MELFHTTAARFLFLCKRTRPDIQPTIEVLSTIVKQPNQGDWNKLLRLIKYLVGTQELFPTLKSDKTGFLEWYVYVAYAVHSGLKFHTGSVLTIGKGTIVSVSQKQKLNTKISMEADLVGADDASSLILWTNIFL